MTEFAILGDEDHSKIMLRVEPSSKTQFSKILRNQHQMVAAANSCSIDGVMVVPPMGHHGEEFELRKRGTA